VWGIFGGVGSIAGVGSISLLLVLPLLLLLFDVFLILCCTVGPLSEKEEGGRCYITLFVMLNFVQLFSAYGVNVDICQLPI